MGRPLSDYLFWFNRKWYGTSFRCSGGHTIFVSLLANDYGHYASLAIAAARVVHRVRVGSFRRRDGLSVLRLNLSVLKSTLSTLVGYFVIDQVNIVLAAGMLFLTPAFFILSVSAGAKSIADWSAIAIGLGLQPLSQKLLGPEIDLLAIGILGGSVAYMTHRMQRRNNL